MSPTQRSLAKLRSDGYTAAITEHWNPYAKVRQDMMGFIDILAIRDCETVAIQTTSGSNVSARLDKMRNIPAALAWVESPFRSLYIHGWRKAGPRGKRKTWECRELLVIPEMLKPKL